MPSIATHRFTGTFRSVGNPDFGQYAPVSDPQDFAADTVAEVLALWESYCVKWQLGGGNEAKTSVLYAGNGKKAFVIFSGKACHWTAKEPEFGMPAPLSRRDIEVLDGGTLTGAEPSCEKCRDLLLPDEEKDGVCLGCRKCFICGSRAWERSPGKGKNRGFVCRDHDARIPFKSLTLWAYYYPKGVKAPAAGEHPNVVGCDGSLSVRGPVALEPAMRRVFEQKKEVFLAERALAGQDYEGVLVVDESRSKS